MTAPYQSPAGAIPPQEPAGDPGAPGRNPTTAGYCPPVGAGLPLSRAAETALPVGAAPTAPHPAYCDHGPDGGPSPLSPALAPDAAAVPAPPPAFDPEAGEPFVVLPALRQHHEGAMPYVPVAAMEAIMALRMRQIHHFGHTLETDLALIARAADRAVLAKAACRDLAAAIEEMMFNREPDQVQRRLARAAALIMAAWDAEAARKETRP